MIRNTAIFHTKIDQPYFLRFQKRTPDVSARHKRLLEKITHRGPGAYNVFLSILREKYPNAFTLLNHDDENFISIRRTNSRPNDNANLSPPKIIPSNGALGVNGNAIPSVSTSNGHMFEKANISFVASTLNNNTKKEKVLEEYLKAVDPKLELTVTYSKKFYGQESGHKVSTYHMQSDNRGVLFLVNIINFKDKGKRIRNGAHADKDNLITLFRAMGFTIFYYEDLTKNVCIFAHIVINYG